MPYKDIADKRMQEKRWYWRLKVEILSYYSDESTPRCKHCGETDVRVLQIDHINGGGSKHRRALGIPAGKHFHHWLKKNGFPIGYQVLCASCNIRKQYEEHILFDGRA